MNVQQEIEKTVQKQRNFFHTGKTLTLEFRLKALHRLEKCIISHEDEIVQALHADLHKAEMESYMTEIGMAIAEIRDVKKHLADWMKEQKVPTPIAQFPARSFTIAEPYGVTLILAPWNYPFLLSFQPLAGAIAAGNCAIVKPSEYSPATGEVIERIIKDAFPEQYIAVIQGDQRASAALLEERFDYIFFTGSASVGKLVMEKAARNLTPVTLELGGKSPCIVDETADLDLSAKRILFGKILNSGQTCVAPDYVLVHESVEEELIRKLEKWTRKFLGKTSLENPNYPKMINEKHFARVKKLMEAGEIVVGGDVRAETLQIEPTVLKHVTQEDPIMQEEIFGPVLPILIYRSKEDLVSVIRSYEKPLALYLFTRNEEMEQWVLKNLSFGGGCINDTIIHLATSEMGFGGVGMSGMGSYHGKFSFETFSHRKSIVKKALWLDLPMRYHPYTNLKEKVVRMAMK
ncbi:MAG: aldehyde dehydrogenase [Lachnospiraceae bacterium]|nr:aldehyde dehydrogenase [Lachnospiraceae bacterium]